MVATTGKVCQGGRCRQPDPPMGLSGLEVTSSRGFEETTHATFRSLPIGVAADMVDRPMAEESAEELHAVPPNMLWV
jgi:hypothetical protein